MELTRSVFEDFLKWKNSADRKPLIVEGARQIGKTWAMKRFGELYYRHTAYFNFESSEDLGREFEKTKDPRRILDVLQLYANQEIVPDDTLIIFDEIQQCNKALNSLKYFCETAPEYHIMAAGSLLGVSLSKGDSFPVGKVQLLPMHPLTFREFLLADNPSACRYLDTLESFDPLPEFIVTRVGESFRRFQVCGGMPAVASALLEGRGMNEIEGLLNDILSSYLLDFARHAPGKDIPRITDLWHSIPSQLAKENRKFLYKVVKEGARAREYEDGLLWLQQAGLIHKIFCSSTPSLPLSAYDDVSAFKIYLCDVGLLRSLAKLPPDIFWTDNMLYKEFKGALAENIILQSLVANFRVLPRYWTSNGTAEIDFLLQEGLSVIPIEVKASVNTSGKSLSVYAKHFSPPLSIIFSMQNLRYEKGVLHVPLFLSDWTPQLLSMISKISSNE